MRPAMLMTAMAVLARGARAFAQHASVCRQCTVRRLHASRSVRASSRTFLLDVEDVDGVKRPVHVLESSPSDPKHPPLVLLGGTAQVIQSWAGHTQGLSKDRTLFILEARCQGSTQLSLKHASIQQHIADFGRITEALGLLSPVDLCGFSFGGRIALAVAAEMPEKVRRLVLTGVPARRDALSRLIIQSWREALARGQLEAFAWNSMLNCHEAPFLERFESKIPSWVDFVVQHNRIEALHAILTQTHVSDEADALHTLQLAKRVTCPTLLLGGTGDRIAPASEIKRLAEANNWPCELIAHTGHNVVFEDAKKWREAVLKFLS